MRRIPKVVPVILLCLLSIVSCFVRNSIAAENNPPGMAALRSGDYAEARKYFEAALKDSGASDEDRVGLLRVLCATGAYPDALKRSGEFLSASGDSIPLHVERGRIAEILGDYPDAEKHYRRAISLSSGRILLCMDAVKQLAGLLEKTGRREEAGSLWDRLLDEYRAGRVHGSRSLGDVAVAAWNRDYVHDANNIFIDATDPKIVGEVSLEALSDFGYLFLDKYHFTDALGVFRDCLKINKAYPEALVGIALAKKYDSNFEAGTYAREALKVNPNFVPALNLLAGLALDEENPAAAEKEIDRALDVNPADLDSLSLKAVCRYFQSDIPAYTQIEKKVLELNPFFGRFYYTLAENFVSRRKYQQAVEFNRKAVELDPGLWAAYVGLGMNLTRIGELEEGRKAIEKAFAGDPFNPWAYNSLELFDQMDGFVRSRSEHFIFLMSKEDSPVISSFASALAEEAYAKLTQRYGFEPRGPLQVEIFPDHGGFEVRTLGLPELQGALGVCFGKVFAIDSPRARKAGYFNWGSALWHEFTHVITLQMSDYNIPRWFSEGLSVSEEHRARPGWGDNLDSSFIKAYKEGKLLKAGELNAGITHPQNPQQIAFSYYQAAMFCEMVEEKFGFEKIRQALRLFAEKVPEEEVFRRILGLSPAEVDAEYARYIDSRIKGIASHLDFRSAGSKLKESDKTTLLETLEKNPGDFFANLRMGTLLRKEGSGTAAEARLKKAQEVFPQYVAPGNPYQELGEMYLELKKEDDALAEFTAWSRLDGDSTLPLIKAADIYAGRREWGPAARMLKLSMYIDPYNQDVLKRLGEAAMESGRWSDAVSAYQALVGLNGTDPAGAHYDLARAYLASSQTQKARREILRSLEIAPSFRKAQELLLKLSGAKR